MSDYAPRDLRKELTDSIIEALEKGTAPWQQPWDAEKAAAFSGPHNAVSGRPYHGGNSLHLMMKAHANGYDDPRWCTYKQAQEQGWQVNKGEKGTLVEYWEFSRRSPKLGPDGKHVTGADGKKVYEDVPHDKPKVFHVTVFNAKQMTGVPPYEKPAHSWSPNEQAESILAGSGAAIKHDGGDRAFYSIREDQIHLPDRAAFPSEGAYYSTALHELGHWTGHESRMNRDGIARFDSFGSPQYAKEELRAELASYFTSAKLGLPHNPGNHAAYVGSWINALKNDKHEIFRAAKDAEAISNYLVELAKGKELGLQADGLVKEEPAGIPVKEVNWWYNHGDSTYGYSAKGVDGETVRRGNYISEADLAKSIGKTNAEAVAYGIGQSERQPDENRTFGKLKGEDLEPSIPAEVTGEREAPPEQDHPYQKSLDAGWGNATREQAPSRADGR